MRLRVVLAGGKLSGICGKNMFSWCEREFKANTHREKADRVGGGGTEREKA